MSQLVYQSEKEKESLTLEKVFEYMGENMRRQASYVIPDLQRAYVWKTKNITNLVDSLLKGWPFGQILIAKTGKLSPRFSPRTFYSKVNQFRIKESVKMEPNWSEDTCLVLDGQQRLQSLFIALSSISGGIVREQFEWIDEYRGRQARHGLWVGYSAPTAYLALNIANYCRAFDGSEQRESVDYSSENPFPVLEWVFKELDICEKFGKRKHLLPDFLHHPWEPREEDKYILLCDIWAAKTRDDIFNSYKIAPEFHETVRCFIEKVQALKQIEIPYTCILSQRECDCNEDEYSEMIISIFTRLNAGGIPLSREDITFSWIKRYWGDSAYTAENCLNKLVADLASAGMYIKSDSLIKLLSSIWAIVEHGGKALVDSDFLNGALLKQIATFLQKNWEDITSSLIFIAETLKKHEIQYGKQFFSTEGIFLTVSWQVIAKMWSANHPAGRVPERVNFDSLFGTWIEVRLDRFIFAGQWGSSFGNYHTSLNKLCEDLENISDYQAAFRILSDWYNANLQNYIDQSKINIAGLSKSTRAGVSAYTTHLWCWQRLDSKRREISNILAQARGGISSGEPNVDHCVAFNFWKNRLKAVYPEGSDDFNNTLAAINQIGNCNVLCKSINCAKSDYTMKEFFQGLGFDCQSACYLRIPAEMFAPDLPEYSVSDILEKIEERTKLIKQELFDFLDGKKCLS